MKPPKVKASTESILVAPDSFKGTFTSVQVAQYIAVGIRQEGLTAIECPLADGGEGTLDVLLLALNGAEQFQSVNGPLGQEVVARWGWVANQRLAIIEVAQACGLHLSGGNPTDALRASTVGVGELVVAAAKFGAEKIIVAMGGSATTDGGQGAIDAIHGNEEVLAGITIEVLSDVTVKFEDAAKVFAPQKGADPATVDLLNKRLDSIAELYVNRYGRDPRGLAQTGAAGGLSGALWAALGAELFSGADYVLDLVRFDEFANTSDAVVLGEGKLDAQSFLGKIVGVAARRVHDRPVLAVVGSTSLDLEESAALGLSHVWVASSANELRDGGKALSEWIVHP
jgi:glycerate kinase